jgi:hypothetical protein
MANCIEFLASKGLLYQIRSDPIRLVRMVNKMVS